MKLVNLHLSNTANDATVKKNPSIKNKNNLFPYYFFSIFNFVNNNLSLIRNNCNKNLNESIENIQNKGIKEKNNNAVISIRELDEIKKIYKESGKNTNELEKLDSIVEKNNLYKEYYFNKNKVLEDTKNFNNNFNGNLDNINFSKNLSLDKFYDIDNSSVNFVKTKQNTTINIEKDIEKNISETLKEGFKLEGLSAAKKNKEFSEIEKQFLIKDVNLLENTNLNFKNSVNKTSIISKENKIIDDNLYFLKNQEKLDITQNGQNEAIYRKSHKDLSLSSVDQEKRQIKLNGSYKNFKEKQIDNNVITNDTNTIKELSLNSITKDEFFFASKIENIGNLANVLFNLTRFYKTGSVNEIELELEPEYLGKLKIKVANKNGSIFINIKVSERNTDEIIKENLKILEDTLTEKGVNIAQISVNLDDQLNKALNSFSESNNYKRESETNELKIKNNLELKDSFNNSTINIAMLKGENSYYLNELI